MAATMAGLIFTVYSGAVCELIGVHIENAGAYHPSIVVLRAGAFVLPAINLKAGSLATIRSCLIVPNYGHGIDAFGGQAELTENVVYKPGSGIRCSGSSVNVIGNVVFDVRDKPKNLDFSDEDAFFWSSGSGCTLLNNAGAGSTGPN